MWGFGKHSRMQGGRGAAVRALQAAANAAARWLWQPKCTFIFWQVFVQAAKAGALAWRRLMPDARISRIRIKQDETV